MKITVTKKHIKRGSPGNGFSCPVALAIIEKLHTKKVNVGMFNITIKGETFAAPKRVRHFIDRFDAPGPHRLRPFSFELVKV